MVGEVEEDGGSGGEGIALLGVVDVFLDGELHSFNDKIAAVRNADCVVEW